MSNIKEVFPKTGDAWLASLPTLIADLCHKWNVDFLQPLPDLTYGFVAAVRRQSDGELLILKMTPAEGPTALEAQWLTLFPEATPQVYDADVSYNAMLMERISPGHTLKELVVNGADEDATRVIAQAIKSLQQRKVQSANFKHLSELASALDILEGRFNPVLLAKAKSLFLDLGKPSVEDILLHGDLHHDNILKSAEGWKVIDPHGYVGDRVFEAAPMLYNPLDHFPAKTNKFATLDRRLRILSEELSFDFQRVRDWGFCMAVLSIAWTFEGSQKVPPHETEVAEVLHRIK